MQAILDFFQSVGKILTGVIDFFIDFIQDVVFAVEVTGRVLANIPNYFTWLPGPLVALLVTIFGIVVIYKIAGREG